MNDLQQKIYDRFVRYVSVETTSNGNSTSVPTTATQLTFGKMLAQEMKEKDAKIAVSPYMHHYVVEAMILSGLKQEALEYLTEYWGGMVERGADTFWEVYVPDDFEASPCKNPVMNSYCHAWSCSASYFIRRYY